MATWQCDFWLVPRSALVARFGAVPTSITPDELDSSDWWVNDDELTLIHALDGILPRGHSLESSVLWGTYDGDSLELVRNDDGEWSELYGRHDLRVPDRSFLTRVAAFAHRFDVLYVSQAYDVLEPNEAELRLAVAASDAQSFVSDPHAFLERLRLRNGTDPPGDAA